MDDPALDEQLHHSALIGLARLNRFSSSAAILWPPIRAAAVESKHRPLRVFDIATGAGDLPIRLWHRARKAGLQLEIEACDISPRSIEFARQRAKFQNAGVKFYLLDALQQELPSGFDCMTCSLFLHHLHQCDAQHLLHKMANAAPVVIVNDLLRSRLGLIVVHFATRLLTRSPVVHTDGPLSVHAAFTLDEIRVIATRAGLTGAKIVRRHPCRFLLNWRRP